MVRYTWGAKSSGMPNQSWVARIPSSESWYLSQPHPFKRRVGREGVGSWNEYKAAFLWYAGVGGRAILLVAVEIGSAAPPI